MAYTIYCYNFFQYDIEIARILFTNIVNDAIEKTENEEAYIEMLHASINRMFTDSSQYNIHFIGALLDIILKQKNTLKLDSNIISNVSQLSGLSSVGALLLEEYLICGIETGPSSAKRSRGVEESDEDTYWIHLAM